MNDDLESTQLARPELGPFVAAARAQTIAGTCVTAESVQAGLEHSRRRSHAQRMLWLSVPVAVAASVLVMVVLSPLWSRDGGVVQSQSVDPDGEQLATGVRMSSTGAAEIRDAWTVVLGEGTHELELEHEPGQPKQPLHIELPGRVLELVEGRATIEVVGHDAAVRLHTGVAAWVGADGRRTHIEVETFELADGEVANEAASPAALAREADRLLATGEREQAIATLRRLVETYPSASQTRAAVLDLARLLDTAGSEAAARCAYELHLERWPDSSVTAEVEAQLARLDEAECRGLDPQ